MLAVAIVATTSTALGVAVNRVGDQPTLPSEQQTRDLLYAKWRQALDEGKTPFCAGEWGGFVCEKHWDRAGGRAAVPRTPPRVAASHASHTVRWLTVCGVTGTGKTYEGEFAVIRSGGTVQPVFFVFWGPTRFLGAFDEGTEPRTTENPPPTPLC